MAHNHALARYLLEQLTNTFQQMVTAQQTAILDLGYSVQDRIQLSVELAHTFYTEGFPPYSAEQVQSLFRQGDLQALIYILLCGGSILETGQSRLFQRPGFTQALRRIDPGNPEFSESFFDDDSVSEMPPDERPAPTAIAYRRPRSRRDPGRVGEHYARRMPDTHLPA